MACFVVPAVEAVITSIATKAVKAREKAPEALELHLDGAELETVERIPLSRKMKWLNNLLWGGSALLAFEHVWHGELVPWAPFLTAAGDPAQLLEMLQEMATAGVAMSAIVTVVWLGMVGVTSAIEKRAVKARAAED